MPVSTLISDHLDSHVSHGESDVASPAGLIGKLPVVQLVILVVMMWLGLALLHRQQVRQQNPQQWLRPPDIPRWPIQLLPPSQGPPRRT